MNNGYDEIGFIAAVFVLAACLLGVTLAAEWYSEWRDR